jgi:predicted DNA-binding mobile mystery protein A
MRKNQLQIEHLDRNLAKLGPAVEIVVPDRGWIHSIRSSIRMSMAQLGARLGITRQSVKELEDREAAGTVSLKVLAEVANALDLHFIYGFVPKDGSINQLIESRALEIASTIVERTSASMSLEDQAVARERLDEAIKDRARRLASELPRFLWD